MSVSITLIGGPTALIEIDGFRLLTDPTFDEPGAYQLPHVKLEKLAGPAIERQRCRRGRRGAAQPRPAFGQSRPFRPRFSQASEARADDGGRRKAARRQAEGFAPWAGRLS